MLPYPSPILSIYLYHGKLEGIVHFDFPRSSLDRSLKRLFPPLPSTRFPAFVPLPSVPRFY